MPKFRCVACRDYIDKLEAISVGQAWVCSEVCKRAYLSRRTAGKKKPPPSMTPEVRASVIRRDGGRCRKCGTTMRIAAHHVRYRSEGGPNTEQNLIALCGYDHLLVHSDKHKYQPILIEMLRAWYEGGEHLTFQEAERRAT